MREKHPSTKLYPPELKERAVRMVQETIEQNNGEQLGVVSRVARQLGIGEESLRAWCLTSYSPLSPRQLAVGTRVALSDGLFHGAGPRPATSDKVDLGVSI
jgi:hypothetical protein